MVAAPRSAADFRQRVSMKGRDSEAGGSCAFSFFPDRTVGTCPEPMISSRVEQFHAAPRPRMTTQRCRPKPAVGSSQLRFPESGQSRTTLLGDMLFGEVCEQ